MPLQQSFSSCNIKNIEAYPSYLLDLSAISASKQDYLTVLGGSSCPKHY
jgi:hypothetical protein